MSIKKEIIQLWQPLAIDILGLSEVENNKRLDYLKDIYHQRNANYHKQLLIDFWYLMTGYEKEFKGLIRQINYPTNLKDTLSDYTVEGINFKDFFSGISVNGKVDIGLSKTLKSPNQNSPLVKLMVLLDKYIDPDLKEFPKELLKFINKESDFYFPQWLLLLEQQFDKITKEIDKTRILDKN